MRPTDVSTPARLAHLTKDGRGYPILATVSRSPSGVDFGALSELRKLALATFDWCGVCGLPFGAEARWQVAMTAYPRAPDRCHRLEITAMSSSHLFTRMMLPSCQFGRLGQ